MGRAGSLVPIRNQVKLQAVSQGLTLWLGQFSDLTEPQKPHFSNAKPNYHRPGVIVPRGPRQAEWRSISFPPTEHRGKRVPGRENRGTSVPTAIESAPLLPK